MKRIVYTALALILCLCLFAVPALAAGTSASLTGPGTVRAGDTITLTFSLEGTGISVVTGELEYDSTLLELKESALAVKGGWTGGLDGNILLVWDDKLETPINSKTNVLTLKFKVKSDVATGTTIRVAMKNLAPSDGQKDIPIEDAVYATTIAAPKSSDNTLASLTVSNATISPAFSAGKTSYTAEVPFEVSKLNVQATANDSKAKVSISSPNLTAGGTTKVTVTVTAENGAKKTYTISVKRAQDPNYVESDSAELSGITVNGFVLSPGFSADQDQYVVWLPYETESVTVTGKAVSSKATVTVEGGSNLIAGVDNEIRVICTAEDGTQKVYTIIAKRAPAHGEDTEPTEPDTEPTESETQPVEPGTEPTAPAPTAPQGGCNCENDCGNPWWLLLIIGALCFAGGAAAGIFLDKKYLNKK